MSVPPLPPYLGASLHVQLESLRGRKIIPMVTIDGDERYEQDSYEHDELLGAGGIWVS